MERRQFLKSKTLLGTASLLGLSGCLAEAQSALAESIGEEGMGNFAVENPKGEKIGERTFGTQSYITEIEYFDGGFVDVHLLPDHNRDRIAVQHHMLRWGSTGDEFRRAYQIWPLPQFSGPGTYDLKSVLLRNGRICYIVESVERPVTSDTLRRELFICTKPEIRAPVLGILWQASRVKLRPK